LRISSEQGHPARLIVSGSGPHDYVLATIKKMPFPLQNREFVVRQVSAADTNGDLLYAALPVGDVIDYGMTSRTVRGVSRGIIRITPSGKSQCKITYNQYLDAGGVIPTRVIESKIPLALSAVVELRDEFQRDDEIDKMERDELARVIKDEQQVYSEDEDSLIQRVQDKLGALKEEDFEELESPDLFVKMGKMHAEGDGRMIIRASTTMDSSIEECAASEMDKMGRQNTKSSTNLVRTLVYDNGHSAVFHFVKDFHIPGFAPREWVLRMLWKKLATDTVAVCFESIDGRNEANNKYVRASNSVYNEYKRLEPLGEVPQTRVTWTQRIEMGGSLSRQIVAAGAPKQLMHLSTMRQQFDKSLDIDGATRARNVGLIADHSEQYSEEENALLEEGEKHFADFKEMKAKRVKMASPLTTGEIAFKKKGRHAWGRATTTVRASPEEVLAFLWDARSRTNTYADTLEVGVDEEQEHTRLIYVLKTFPKPLRDRDVLTRCLWKKQEEGGFLYSVCSEESEGRPHRPGIVRAKVSTAARIVPSGRGTKLEYFVHPDAGGRIPNFVMNAVLRGQLAYVTEIQEYFQELRLMEDYDADDGKALGVRLMHPGGEKGKKPWRKVRDVVEKHRSLKKLSIEFDWLAGFLEEVVRGKWVMAASVSTKLECLSKKEARKIGRSLMPALKQRKTALAGLHQWKMQNRSMVELFERYDWVESMLLEVAQEVMKTAPWGLMWRVCTGATLSVLDIVTDVVVIVGYMGKEETRGYGYSLLMMLVGSMALQVLIVFGQNRKKPWVMAKEILVVVTGLKPAW